MAKGEFFVMPSQTPQTHTYTSDSYDAHETINISIQDNNISMNNMLPSIVNNRSSDSNLFVPSGVLTSQNAPSSPFQAPVIERNSTMSIPTKKEATRGRKLSNIGNESTLAALQAPVKIPSPKEVYNVNKDGNQLMQMPAPCLEQQDIRLPYTKIAR